MPNTLTHVPFYETPEITRAISPEVAKHLGSIVVSGQIIGGDQVIDHGELTLSRPSDAHGRSIDVSGSATDGLKSLVGKGAISLKGAGPYELSPHKALSADRIGWTPTGFMSGEAIERVAGVSEFMQRIGVPAEQFLGTAKPKTFPIVDNDNSDSTPRHMNMNDIYEHIQPGIDIPDGHELIVYARKMVTSIRPTDLGSTDRDGAKTLFTKLAEDLAVSLEDPEMTFDPSDPESIKDYIVRKLPQRLGSSLAKVHDAGCSHNSLTAGDVTAAGEFVDLDSVTGEPLGFGDKKILPVDMLGDFFLLIGGLSADITPIDPHQQFIGNNSSQLQNIATMMSIRGIFDSLESDSSEVKIRRLDEGKKLSAEMVENFLNAYEAVGKEGSLSRAAIKLYREGRKLFEAARAAELSGVVYG